MEAMVAANRLLLLVLPIMILVQGSSASADDGDAPQPPPQPYPQPYPPPPPIYPAPLSQETQTTYVPQSVALSGPRMLRDVDGREAPLGYTAVQRKRKGLLIGGWVTLGVTYGISALTWAIGEDTRNNFDGTQDKNEVAAMWIPVAGPFIQIVSTESATAKVFLVGLGGAQVAGALMIYYGMTSTRRVFIRNDLVGNVTVSPLISHGASGLALSGNF
jgi:hypothetical protein